MFLRTKSSLVGLLLSPIFLISMTWGGASLLGAIFSDGIDIEVWVFVTLFYIAFCIGILISKVVLVKSSISSGCQNYQVHYLFLMILTLVNAYYFLQIIFQVLTIGPQFFYLYRMSVIEGSALIPYYSFHIGVLQITFGLSTYLLVSRLSEYESSMFFLYLVTLFTLILTLVDGSRSFFMMGIVTFISLLLYARKIKLSHAIFSLVIISILFILSFSVIRGTEDSFIVGLDYLIVYLSGGIRALNFVVNGSVEVPWGDLLSINNKFHSIGLSSAYYNVKNMPLEFIDYNEYYQTNVFTALGVYYSSFGYAFLLYAFLFGLVSQFLYSRFLNRVSAFSIFCYVIFINAIVFSVFHDYTINLAYYLLKVSFVLGVISLLSLLACSFKVKFLM